MPRYAHENRKAVIEVRGPAETTVLTGAQVADGTGQPLRHADVLLHREHISAIEPPGVLPTSGNVVDLSGLVLAPGFIDVHSHADNAPLLTHDDTTKIAQGVTTEVVGNCGFSLAPRRAPHGTTLATFLERLFPPLEFTWSSFAELFAATDHAGYVTNYCPLVGHGTLRIAAMGMDNRPPDETEIREMRSALDEGMAAGAFGLSSGLIYPPAVFSTTDELVALAHVLGGNGLYTTHMRDEGSQLLEAIDEALHIGATAGRTHLSHLKASGPANWGKVAHALARIDTTRQAGHDVKHDVYPYTASSTMLTATLPPDFLAGDEDAVLTRLTSPEGRNSLTSALANGRPGWENHGDGGWDSVLVSTTASHRHEGHTLADLAHARGCEPVEALIDLLVSERLRVSMVNFSMSEHDLSAALMDEHTMIGSDGLPPGTGGQPHPRLYGTFPRVLGRYSRDQSVFSLAEAVRRMTSLPAHQFRIPQRGRIAPNLIADLVAFAPTAVRDIGDYLDPEHPPAGIPWVWQSGRTVVRDGEYLGGRHGQRLAPTG